MSERENLSRTAVHTKVNDEYRISSIYRNWGIEAAPHLCGWETFVWKREGDEETIEYQEETPGGRDNVEARHKVLADKILTRSGFGGDGGR